MLTISKNIKQKALELGFHKVGFAKVESLGSDEKYFRHYLKNGYQGTMAWLERNPEKRIDPRKILPDAKSIISVAMNYYKHIDERKDNSVANVSRYALGGDYHVVLKTRLNNLLDYIKGIEPSAKGKVFVDSGNIMEKAWAVQSGIGWRGKHSITVTKEYGSWIFLGEILLNLELDYNSPVNDLCGECTKCMDACPTRAIIKPYVLNASRCISYFTIEHKGEIEKSFAEKIDHQIFGCDICQEVCPWNWKNAKPTDVKAFFLNEEYASLKLEELMKLTINKFNKMFKESPIIRSGLKRLKRNVSVVIDNIATKEKDRHGKSL